MPNNDVPTFINPIAPSIDDVSGGDAVDDDRNWRDGRTFPEFADGSPDFGEDYGEEGTPDYGEDLILRARMTDLILRARMMTDLILRARMMVLTTLVSWCWRGHLSIQSAAQTALPTVIF